MYEKATLLYAGMAKSVILGISFMGSDPDGHDFPVGWEFEEDIDMADDDGLGIQ